MSANGRGVVRFDVAINRRRFNRETNQYDDLPPVFHRVVAFGPVAENAAETLRKGLEVVVVGQMADDSYETEAGEKRRQVVLEAQVIAPSLRFAKANVIRVQREQPAPARRLMVTYPVMTAGVEEESPDLGGEQQLAGTSQPVFRPYCRTAASLDRVSHYCADA
jgi:single-strand DNA-binding protein